jgi:3-hydroxyacyl-[acyl-carrier-protein] dehydratase
MLPGNKIAALKRIDKDEDFFKDHFPGFPVVPGVLLTEMMAQTAGKCLDAEKKPRGKAMLARINSASFRKWVQADRDAVIYADIISNDDSYATAKCRVEVDNDKVCTSELFFTFVKIENFSPDYVDEVLESFLASGGSEEA